MTPELYKELSERTEKKFPEGMKFGYVETLMLMNLLDTAEKIGNEADIYKKALVYGNTERMEQGIKALKDKWPVETRIQMAKVPDTELNQKQAELLHALLGKLSEMQELIAALGAHIFDADAELDAVNVSEELADDDWYDMIICRVLGLDEMRYRAANIEKLRKRYPDAFDADKANNRDLDEERRMLELGVE